MTSPTTNKFSPEVRERAVRIGRVRTMAPALTDPTAAFDPASQLPVERRCDDPLNPPCTPLSL
jgi:hypothetical protein